MAKSTPYLSCHRDNFPAKVPGLVAGWLRQVTQPPFIAGPSDCLPVLLETEGQTLKEFFNLLITRAKIFSASLKTVQFEYFLPVKRIIRQTAVSCNYQLIRKLHKTPKINDHEKLIRSSTSIASSLPHC